MSPDPAGAPGTSGTSGLRTSGLGTSGLAGFRRLLGLAPAGRIAVLRALLSGKKSLDALIRASALPRRDVEEFLAALDDLEGDPGKLLAEYTASRAAAGPGDEEDLTPVAQALIEGVPAPLKRLDHVQATPETLVRRVRWLTDTFDLSGRSVLFAGDHDVTSLLLHRAAPDANLTVVDIDERLLSYVDERSGSRVRCVYADFRFGLPPALAETADVVVTDPPYTPEGLGLFLTRCLQSLHRDEAAARIVIAYGHSRRRPDLGVAAQREILRQDAVIDAMFPAFNSYDGAQAVGSASDWYSCQATARAFRRLDQAARAGGAAQHGSQAPGIYTHGEQSVESTPRAADSLADVLSGPGLSGPGLSGATTGLIFAGHAPAGDFAVTAGLAKLLEDGLHPSVTGRAEEFIVDLRDDPGPWLLRAMLALNAPRASFVVDARHEELRDLAVAAGPWTLPRAKYETVSLERLPDHGLTAVRCVLADETTDDPGLALARYVTRRPHGKLRNVWREALITFAARNEKTLTKRTAADLADESASAAGCGNDLALRLIDAPAHHFPALLAALTHSITAARA